MNRDLLTADLVRDEGERLRLYKCPAGKWTVGVGHNIEDNGISQAASRFILAEDIAAVEKELDQHVPWWREMTEPRQRALANLCFNLGWPKLSEFKKTLGFLYSGQYLDASQELMRSKWARQVGDRAVRIAIQTRGV